LKKRQKNSKNAINHEFLGKKQKNLAFSQKSTENLGYPLKGSLGNKYLAK